MRTIKYIICVGLLFVSMPKLFSQEVDKLITNIEEVVTMAKSPDASNKNVCYSDRVYLGLYGFVKGEHGQHAPFDVYEDNGGEEINYYVKVAKSRNVPNGWVKLYPLTDEMKKKPWVYDNRWTHCMQYDSGTWYVNMNSPL